MSGQSVSALCVCVCVCVCVCACVCAQFCSRKKHTTVPPSFSVVRVSGTAPCIQNHSITAQRELRSQHLTQLCSLRPGSVRNARTGLARRTQGAGTQTVHDSQCWIRCLRENVHQKVSHTASVWPRTGASAAPPPEVESK